MACKILERTTGFKPLSEIMKSFFIIVLSYLKLITVENFCPLILISLWVQFALFDFGLFSNSDFVQVLSRLSTGASSSCSSSARASMSTANHRLVMFLPPLQKMLKKMDKEGILA